MCTACAASYGVCRVYPTSPDPRDGYEEHVGTSGVALADEEATHHFLRAFKIPVHYVGFKRNLMGSGNDSY